MQFGGGDNGFAALLQALVRGRQQQQPQQPQMPQSPLMAEIMQIQPRQFNMPQGGGGGSVLGGMAGGMSGMLARQGAGGMGMGGGPTFSPSKAWGNWQRGGPADGGQKS